MSIRETTEHIYDLFAAGSGTIDIFFMLLVVLLLVSKNRKLQFYFIIPSIIITCFIINPLSISIFVKSGFLTENRYVRLFWLLPVGLIIVYGCTLLIKFTEKKRTVPKYIVMFSIVLLMVYLGDYMITEDNFQQATNIYKLPDSVVEVTDIIIDDILADEEEVSNVRIAVPLSLSPYIRQYNAEIKMLYGRNSGDNVPANEMRRNMDSNEYYTYSIQEYGRRGKCSYLVLESTKNLIEPMENYGYILIGTVDEYLIYKDMEQWRNSLWGEKK